VKEKFNTEVEFWERLYKNIQCVYNDENRVFYIVIWEFHINEVIYLPCLIDNIPTKLIRK
jgi:hypothetical protein